jgi:excisionase family DNA binding protein
MTLDDLGSRLFADVPQAASILGRDERTVRKAAAAGDIPATKVGNKWMIQTAWLRQQAGITEAPPAASVPDLDELADRVADRVFARFAGLFAARIGGDSEAA